MAKGMQLTLDGREVPVGDYVYAWGNNEKRAQLKGRQCRLIAVGKLGSVLIEFPDTGEKIVTSRRALRR